MDCPEVPTLFWGDMRTSFPSTISFTGVLDGWSTCAELFMHRFPAT